MSKAILAVVVAGLAAVATVVGIMAYFWWSRPGGGQGPSLSWPITEEPNTYITKTPTAQDFVPIGVTYELGEDGRLTYLPDPRWKQSCFILVAVGWTEDRQHMLFYQGRLPFTGEGGFRPRICVDGQYVLTVPRFGGGMYYDPDGTPGRPYPTVYVGGEGGYVETISYDVEGQRWFHTIEPPPGSAPDALRLELIGQALGVPFWMGPMEGPYIVHGAYSNVEDVDIWGGFWVSGTFRANLTLPGQGTLTFEGHFLFDRATHRVCYGPSAAQAGPIRGSTGAVLAFSCIVVFHEEFYIMISHSDNPSPAHFPRFQHQGRINIVSRGLSSTFNDFTLISTGNPLQPSGFRLYGPFEGGYVDLTGEAVAYWPPSGWHVNKGTWWDPEGRFTWGRALIRWTGTVRLGDEVVQVSGAMGVGEFTRFMPGSTAGVAQASLPPGALIQPAGSMVVAEAIRMAGLC